jgi:crotonobetainyl-CoA:carnitine CoA-transferase CaiB-like acyl-CoA transferase
LPYTTSQWVRFFEAVGRPELAADPRVTDAAIRVYHIDELYQIVAGIVVDRTTAEWCELLRGADIPMTPVIAPEDLLEDEHLQQTGFFKLCEHPSEGEFGSLGYRLLLARTPARCIFLAPSLGEHQRY